MFFPIFLSLSQQKVLTVGTGPLIDNKRRLLEKAGTDVEKRPDAPTNLTGYRLIIADLPEEEAADLAARARAAAIPVNIIDRPHLSDFIVPAMIDRAPVTIAIGTEGSAPVLARRLRVQIDSLLPQRLGALAALVGRSRAKLKAKLADIASRRRFWDRVLDGPVAALALQGREEEAQAALDRLLDAPMTPDRGLVQLVGAGPGDPDLLTLKAVRALQQADVILYDDLVSPQVLEFARRDAEQIFVGKRKGFPGIGQQALHELLAERARSGQRVVRLKGGDSFIFGRGGEEVERLRAAGITVEVVAGITAALGAAAEQMLPLTHRGEAAAVTLLTAHQADGAPPIDWRNHAAPETTLAIYMGRDSAAAVMRGLIAAGRDAGTPAAVLARATRPDSRAFYGRLDQLPLLAAQAGDGPALLLVGETLRRAAAWPASSSLPLAV